MDVSSSKKAIALLLVLSLTFTFVRPLLAGSKKLPIAFLGIDFENVPNDVRTRISNRVADLLTAESSLDVRKQAEVEKLIGVDQLKHYSNGVDLEALSSLADELDVQHIYAGRISNNSFDSERVLLVGELWRYDRSTNLQHKFEVLKYYENFGVEILRFKNQFVRTIVAEQNTGPRILPYLVLAAVAVAGIATFAIVGSEGGASGGSGQTPVTP